MILTASVLFVSNFYNTSSIVSCSFHSILSMLLYHSMAKKTAMQKTLTKNMKCKDPCYSFQIDVQKKHYGIKKNVFFLIW